MKRIGVKLYQVFSRTGNRVGNGRGGRRRTGGVGANSNVGLDARQVGQNGLFIVQHKDPFMNCILKRLPLQDWYSWMCVSHLHKQWTEAAFIGQFIGREGQLKRLKDELESETLSPMSLMRFYELAAKEKETEHRNTVLRLIQRAFFAPIIGVSSMSIKDRSFYFSKLLKMAMAEEKHPILSSICNEVQDLLDLHVGCDSIDNKLQPVYLTLWGNLNLDERGGPIRTEKRHRNVLRALFSWDPNQSPLNGCPEQREACFASLIETFSHNIISKELQCFVLDFILRENYIEDESDGVRAEVYELMEVSAIGKIISDQQVHDVLNSMFKLDVFNEKYSLAAFIFLPVAAKHTTLTAEMISRIHKMIEKPGMLEHNSAHGLFCRKFLEIHPFTKTT